MTPRPAGVRAVTQLGVYGAAQVLQALLGLALVALLARAMGRTGFGQYSFAFVVASLGSLIAEFGLGTWLTRAVAQAPARTAPLLLDVLRLRLRLLAIAWVVTLGGCALYFHDLFRVESVAAMLAYLTAMGYVGVWEGLLLGRGRVGRVAISVSIGKVLELTVVGAALLLGVRPRVPQMALALALATIARVALLAWMARPALHDHAAAPSAGATVSGGPDGAMLAGASPADATTVAAVPTAAGPATGGRFLLEVLPFALGAWMWTAYFKVDVLILERLATPVGLGLYTAAYRVIEALMMLPRTVMAVMYPRVAAAWNGRSLAGGLPAAPGRMLFLVSLAAGVGLWVLARPVMSFLFGAPFADGDVALRALALALPVLFMNQYLGMVLPATHRQGAWVVLLVGALVVNVAANIALIPRLGFVGAAWATLASEIFLLAAYVVMVTRRHGGIAGPAWFVRAALATGGMGLGVYFVPGPLFARVAAGAALFVVLAIATRAVNAQEQALAVAFALRAIGRAPAERGA